MKPAQTRSWFVWSSLLHAGIAGAILALGAPHALADTFEVELDAAARTEPATGRLILFFVTPSMRGWERASPISAPFFSSPQPIASIAVEKLAPGGRVQIDGSVFAFDGAAAATLGDLHGPVRVQALLDVDNTERSHMDGPGNLVSEVQQIELDRDSNDEVHLKLVCALPPSGLPPEGDGLKWVELRSELLSAFYGRDVFHRAGVALPRDYETAENAQRQWPAIYIVPGFGGRHNAARHYAQLFQSDRAGTAIPPAVHVVLDPESPLGHHGFVDSANNGPRSTALVRELIPYLEQQFRLAPQPEGRIVTGHSSGGWSSLWLQMQWPDVFGACFSSAPDPIDFRAFQVTNIYDDPSAFTDRLGAEQPSMRNDESDVRMTVRQENLMEYAIDPLGRSGEQWDTWESMFSPRDEKTAAPRQLFNAVTGSIDHEVAETWRPFDITHLVTSDWAKYGPIVTQRVRLACGTLDSFYLNRAVESFKREVEKLNGASLDDDDAPGYIFLVEGADHGTVSRATHNRWNREIREHLAKQGLLIGASPPLEASESHSTDSGASKE